MKYPHLISRLEPVNALDLDGNVVAGSYIERWSDWPYWYPIIVSNDRDNKMTRVLHGGEAERTMTRSMVKGIRGYFYTGDVVGVNLGGEILGGVIQKSEEYGYAIEPLLDEVIVPDHWQGSYVQKDRRGVSLYFAAPGITEIAGNYNLHLAMLNCDKRHEIWGMQSFS